MTSVDRPRSLRALRVTIVGVLAITATMLGVASAPTTASASSGYVYWTNVTTNTIGRSSLDGSAASQSFIQGANLPYGVAVSSTHIYWANFGSNTIGRANLDGTDVNQSFITGLSPAPVGMAVSGDYLLWGTGHGHSIGRANLDGSGVNQSFISGLSDTSGGVSVDATYVYWTDFGKKIGRAKLDGTTVNQDFITGLTGTPEGVAVNASKIYFGNSAYTPGVILGSANLDGSGVVQSFVTGIQIPSLMTADATHVYWTNMVTSAGAIGRANTDGTGVEQNFISVDSGLGSPRGVAVTGSGGGLQAPGTPGAPLATPGDAQATVTITAPTTGGAPESYTVTASPGGATCSVTVPATACTVTGLTNGESYTFTATATNAAGTSSASIASNAVRPTPTAKAAQTPAGGCVKRGNSTSIPLAGFRKLMTPNCVTSAQQRIGVRVVAATPRGDQVYYRLYCTRAGSTAKLPTVKTSGGYERCRNGKMNIQTFGVPLRLRLTWHAPAIPGYLAYTMTKTYLT